MTLSDSLISIFVLVIISMLVVGIFVSYYRYFQIEVAHKNLNASNITALDNISTWIRGAVLVVETMDINGTIYTSDSDTLILELPSLDSQQNIIPDIFDNIVFYRDTVNSNLLKSDILLGTGSNRSPGVHLVANYLDSITFNYNDTSFPVINKVEVIISSDQTVHGKQITLGAQTTVKMRNK